MEEEERAIFEGMIELQCEPCSLRCQSDKQNDR